MYDITYKQELAKALKIDDLSLLNSIVGEEEFKTLNSTFDVQSYSPGKRLNYNKVDSFDFENLKNHKFCVNLHVHTSASDGLSDIRTILDSAVKIADENFINSGFGFMLAITDHDTVENAVNAVKIITSDKEKYKNLKLVLGCELSTVATNFRNQKKTLDIHTLLYCLNPFEQKLSSFLKTKIEKKYLLANKTLEDLNTDLADLLSQLNIKLSLEEAAKIHPMITKGQDEVSHPLKKYIFAKTLYSYYVDNNYKIKDILQNSNVSENMLSYEKPVYMYKSMFNNDRYFYIYREALEKYLNFITDNKFSIKLENIPKNIENALLLAKQICEKSHPSANRSIDAFSVFEDTLEFINTLDYGLISIAHPARINYKYVDSHVDEFFDEFWQVFKQHGKSRALAYEKYYQAYTGEKRIAVLPIIEKSASKYNLLPTGGIDSHAYCVYSRSPIT